jgi:signal transduction histidine kinase
MEAVAVNALNFVLGALEAGLAIVVLRHIRHFGRAFPWLAALMVFFLLRAADRFFVAFAGDEPVAFSVIIDVLAIAMLVLLLVGMERMIHGLQSVQDQAAMREAEYRRALRDYRRLIRHRIANPLAVVRGGVQTVLDLPDLAPEERERILRDVAEAGERLERVALRPEPVSREESSLEGRARLAQP